MKRLLTSLAAIIFALCSEAQDMKVSISLSGDIPADEIRLFFYPLDVAASEAPMEKQADGSYVQTVPLSPMGFYKIVCVTGTAQYYVPAYFDSNWASEAKCQLTFSEGSLAVSVLPEGKKKDQKAKAAMANGWQEALHVFDNVYYEQSRNVWINAPKFTQEDIKAVIAKYSDAAAEASSRPGVTPALAQYVRTWAFIQQNEAISAYNRMHEERINPQEILTFKAWEVLDCEYAKLFQSSTNIAVQSIPRGTLGERLAFAGEHYKYEPVRQSVQEVVLNGFIRGYDFSKGYQQGLDMLLDAQAKHDIPQAFVDKFRERASAVPGAKFPDVALVDAEGNSVSMQQFRGKYVYIDLWASWCVPCVKEVPHLQQLEKELDNPDVVFVSISTDSSDAPWKKKMEQLNMHGNQWLNTDGKLCDKLNVSGIPHFLIYDKEGNLHTYNAPRPSTGSVLKGLLEGLK